MNPSNQAAGHFDNQGLTHSNLVKEFWTMFRYGLVGLMNTGVFALFAWLLRNMGLHYTAYTAIAYCIAILFSFLMNKLFTFRKKDTSFFSLFSRFLLAALSLAGLVQLIQFFVIEVLEQDELIGVIGGMVFYTGTGYVINRIWVFRGVDETFKSQP